MKYSTSGTGYRDAIKSDGTTAGYEADKVTGYCALVAGTFYFPIGGDEEAALESAWLEWSAAFAATITFEDTNAPKYADGSVASANIHVSDYAAAPPWVPENPSTAIVAVVGASNSSTAATVTAGGAAAGACMFHVGNFGARRGRIKVVVTVGGNLRCIPRSKVGG